METQVSGVGSMYFHPEHQTLTVFHLPPPNNALNVDSETDINLTQTQDLSVTKHLHLCI